MIRKVLIVAVAAFALWPMRATLQQPAPGGAAGEWWAVMEPVFRLDGAGHAAAHSEPARRA